MNTFLTLVSYEFYAGKLENSRNMTVAMLVESMGVHISSGSYLMISFEPSLLSPHQMFFHLLSKSFIGHPFASVHYFYVFSPPIHSHIGCSLFQPLHPFVSFSTLVCCALPTLYPNLIAYYIHIHIHILLFIHGSPSGEKPDLQWAMLKKEKRAT